MNNYLQQAEATETKLGYYQDKYKYHEAMEKIIKIIDEKRTERDALNDIINQEKAKLEVIATE
jgi:RNAse (barnase) inhibitor barstar